MLEKSLRQNLSCLAVSGLICFTSTAYGHGYISFPESRSYLCKLNQNRDCGPIQWEPQSVEGPDGFPAGGAPDGQLAGAGWEPWSPLNEQGLSRWVKRPITAGTNTFNWHFTAPHATLDWRYFITKSGWDPDQPLTRNSFDLNPFCRIDGQMKRPAFDIAHQCQVPARTGYHVIMALWDVGDTDKTFYQVVDVQFPKSARVDSSESADGKDDPFE